MLKFTSMSYQNRTKTHTMKEWAKLSGLTVNTIRSRWGRGIRGDALFRPINEPQYSQYDYVTWDTGDGKEIKTLKEWAEELSISKTTLITRYGLGERGAVLFRRIGIHRKSMLPPEDKPDPVI